VLAAVRAKREEVAAAEKVLVRPHTPYISNLKPSTFNPHPSFQNPPPENLTPQL
jgi:hypothetical protein